LKAGFFESAYGKFPKLQLFTREASLWEESKVPWIDPSTFKKAEREASGVQDILDF
jgi:hypothetical protein